MKIIFFPPRLISLPHTVCDWGRLRKSPVKVKFCISHKEYARSAQKNFTNIRKLPQFVWKHWKYYTIRESSYFLHLIGIQGVSKKQNTFDLEYLKAGSIKLIVLLVCYSILPYNSIEPNFSFLWLSEAKIFSF